MKSFILFLILFLPFQFALNPSPGIDLSVMRILIPFAFLWWLITGFVKRKVYIPQNFVTLGLILFFLCALLSMTTAQNLGWSLRKILVFASILPIYFLVTAYFKKGDFCKISHYIVTSSTIIACIGIFQFVSQFVWGSKAVFSFWAHHLARFFLGVSFSHEVISYPSWWVNIGGKTYLRATAFFPDPHMMAFFLGMSLPFFAPLIFRKNNSWQRSWFYGAIATINLTALLFTFSRGGYLGLVMASAWLIVYGWWHAHKKQKMIIAIALLLLVVILASLTPVRTRFISSFNVQEGSVAGRLIIWQNAFDIWLSNFWLGVGIGNYSYYQNPLNNYRTPIYAHNTYLDIAVEMGIFTLLVWLAVFGYAILRLFREIKLIATRRSVNVINHTSQLFCASLIASLIYFLVHSFFDTPIYSPRILPFLMIILGLASILISTSRFPKQKTAYPSKR